ncbi:MAG TPA: hypothetical protein VEW05_05685 [Candidatus Polarisedimenticolia bacterium]|nr:hypothetical protein [Candidatus Polarisedimenticolia bacterium]
MLPSDLKPEQFNGYPPEARKLVIGYVAALQRLPLSFLPNLLREVIEYDFKFPAERRALEKELANLNSLSSEQIKDWLQGFARIRLSSQLENSDWVNAPGQFVEQLSSHLWTTHQLDTFRIAAVAYADRLRAVVPVEPPPASRLGITVIGQGVTVHDEPLFRKLRSHGAYFSGVKPENGLELLLNVVAARAKAHPLPYAHWYIDGGQAAAHDPALTCVSYHALEPVRAALSAKIRAEIQRPGMGPEALRTHLAQLRPADLGLGKAGNAVLDRFQVKMLTEGSGTQIFSTTFAQWTAREALRRAQPLTLLVRFAPRQRQKPMNEMLSASRQVAELDPLGSLMDADMGAYYNWLNLQRLTGADQSSFLVWFEGHNEAVAIGPSLPRGTVSNAAASLEQLLSWAS